MTLRVVLRAVWGVVLVLWGAVDFPVITVFGHFFCLGMGGVAGWVLFFFVSYWLDPVIGGKWSERAVFLIL
ncbi:hypothetical protein [Deinococcus pimensis]|uniref:hypothetical protein n=1 Tax=Deinococcus pimensis TaxID=309888 RepID=UPI00146FC3D8|nr:hypothetical protein [Deinococcus pimensis]